MNICLLSRESGVRVPPGLPKTLETPHPSLLPDPLLPQVYVHVTYSSSTAPNGPPRKPGRPIIPNDVCFASDVAILSLQHGRKQTTIDASDYRIVCGLRWCWTGKYVVAYDPATRRRVRLHTVLLGTSPVDHRDGDPLNNRRSNLRPATQPENARNTAPRKKYRGKPTKSRFKGVFIAPPGWRAIIISDHIRRHLGCFKTEEEAARAYDAAAIRYHGEFARLNFPAANYSSRSAALLRTSAECEATS